MAEFDPEAPAAPPPPVGERLRAARVQQGLDVAEIASRTRVPQRHLEAIERGDYAALPAPTYATGFTRAYARVLGLDEVALTRDLRGELAQVAGAPEYVPYAAADPARVPPRWLAWGGALAALVVLALFGWWYASRTALPDAVVTTTAATDPKAATPRASLGGATSTAPVASAPTEGPVVILATAPAWLRITDAAGTRLLEREMAAGERYQVPGDADRPTILTGRPDALTITVGGRAIPPLGDGSRSVSGIELTPAALTARAAAATAAPAGTRAPAAPIGATPAIPPPAAPAPQPAASEEGAPPDAPPA